MFRLEGKQKGGGDIIGAEARISENVLNMSLNNIFLCFVFGTVRRI